MRSLIDAIRGVLSRRRLLAEEEIILAAVRQKYPAHARDKIFFVTEPKPLLPVRSSAIIQVWGNNGEGPSVHLTNLAGFMKEGMSLDEIKSSQI